MTNTTAPEQWSYEHGDPSVGIFGGSWVHETCPLPDIDPDADIEVIEEVVSSTHQGNGINRTRVVTYKLTCSCGMTTTVDDHEWDPEGIPDDIPDYDPGTTPE
jgi:hypothetical protein